MKLPVVISARQRRVASQSVSQSVGRPDSLPDLPINQNAFHMNLRIMVPVCQTAIAQTVKYYGAD